MIEYCIAKKEHLVQILELYKQLIPDEQSTVLYQLTNRIKKNNFEAWRINYGKNNNFKGG